MKRSSSFSHIPRLSTVYRPPRAASRDRGSTSSFRDTISTKKDQKAYTDTKNSKGTLKAVQLFTPTPSRAVNRITPSSSATSSSLKVSRDSRSSSMTVRSPLAQKKKIFLNDKKWVAENFLKIQDFIRSNSCFNPDLLKCLKPPTIALFVNLMNVIFKEIMPDKILNTQNYADVVLSSLKTFCYSAPVTLSTLKTINTLHGWPSFVAITCFFIERYEALEFAREYAETSPSYLSVMFRYFKTEYEISAEGPTNHLENQEKLLSTLTELFMADAKSVEQCKKNIEKETLKLEQLEIQYQGIIKDIEDYNAKFIRINKEIGDYEDGKYNPEHLENEFHTLNMDFETKKQQLQALQKDTNKLKKLKLTNRYDRNDKALLLKQIDDVKKSIEDSKENLKDILNIRDRLEIELTAALAKIRTQANQWNLSLLESFLPSEFKNLEMRTRGFSAANEFLAELTEISKIFEPLKEKLLAEYSKNLILFEDLIEKRTKLEADSKVGSLKICVEKNESELRDLKKIFNKLQEEIILCDKEWYAKISELNKELETGNQKIEQEIKELEAKKLEIEEKHSETAENSIRVLTEAHNNMVEHKEKIVEVMKQELEDAASCYGENRQRKKKLLETLAALKKSKKKLLAQKKAQEKLIVLLKNKLTEDEENHQE